MITRGSYVHKPVVKFLGASQKCVVLQISQNIDGFRQINSQRLLEFIVTLTKPILEIFFLRHLPNYFGL